MNTITSLSKDILLEILIRLPPKSAVRFRCVCKSFYSLIPEPQFSFTILLPVPTKTKTHDDRRLNLHTISYSEESQAKLQANRLQHLDLQGFQGGINSSFAEGKICLISSVGEAGVYDLSTRQHISLPRIHSVNSDSNCTSFFTRAVLGFDPVSKLYKILRTELYYDRRSGDSFNRLWVLTVGVDESWRNINPVIPGYVDDHLHIDGIIYFHWGGCSEIAAFDVRTESFELIPFSYYEFPYHQEYEYEIFMFRYSSWVNLNNRLALIHIIKQGLRAKIDIWRLEKSKEWVKHVVPIPLEVSEIIGQAAPMGFTSNSMGEIVFFMQGKNMPPMILVYAFGRQVWRKFEICGLHDYYLYLRDPRPTIMHVVEEKVGFSE